MTAWSRAAMIGVLASGLPVGPAFVPPVAGQTPAQHLTTDTPEYCAHLIERLHDTERDRPPPREVVALSGEGERMCDHGQVPAGVQRLRRAFRIMMGGEAP